MIGGDTVNVDPVIEPKETLAHNKLANTILGWKSTKNIVNEIDKLKNKLGME